MVYVVNGVLASGVDMVLEKDLAGFALQEMEIHPLMLLTLSMIFQTFSPTLHNPSMRHTRASYVEMILTMVMIVYHGSRFTHTPEPSRRFNYFYDDNDYEESTIPLNEIFSQIPPSIAITPVLPTLEPGDSLVMGNEELSTILEKESDEVIKSSVEDLVSIPSETEDTFVSDSECDLPSYIDVSTNIKNGYHDSKGDIIYLESLLIDDAIPNLPPEVFLDHDPRSLKDELDKDDLMTEDKDCPDFEDSHAREIPSGEIKVHIEVLSVLWENRLPIPDGSLPLSR
ncbi:hypothetical protein Tco_0619715 [Tanacetum coccineum]